MHTTIVGKPGAHALTRVRDIKRAMRPATAAAVATGIISVAAGITALWSLTTGGLGVQFSAFVVGTIISATTSSGITRSQRADREQIGRYQRGIQSEQRVLNALRRTGASLIVNGAEVNAGGDADHVILRRLSQDTAQLAVVETKTGGGRVLVSPDALFTANGKRRIPNDPVRQASRQAAGLARMTGVPGASAIVCIVDMTNGPLARDGVVICSLQDLPRVVAALPTQRVTNADAERLRAVIRVKD